MDKPSKAHALYPPLNQKMEHHGHWSIQFFRCTVSAQPLHLTSNAESALLEQLSQAAKRSADFDTLRFARTCQRLEQRPPVQCGNSVSHEFPDRRGGKDATHSPIILIGTAFDQAALLQAINDPTHRRMGKVDG